MIPSLIDADDPRHGTVNAYVNLWCRCGECRRAWATYKRTWRNADPARQAAHAESSRRYRAQVQR